VDDEEEALGFYKQEKFEELDHDLVSIFQNWREDDDEVRLSNTMRYMKLPIRFRFYIGETKAWKIHGVTVELRSFESPLCFWFGPACDRCYNNFSLMDPLLDLNYLGLYYHVAPLPSARLVRSDSEDVWHALNDVACPPVDPVDPVDMVRCVHRLDDLERVDWEERVRCTAFHRVMGIRELWDRHVCTRRELVGAEFVDMLQSRMRDIRESGGDLSDYRILFWYD
jgi:hypothetical protein